nr:hypothetical protein [Tanacetum cinerariifolium]
MIFPNSILLVLPTLLEVVQMVIEVVLAVEEEVNMEKNQKEKNNEGRNVKFITQRNFNTKNRFSVLAEDVNEDTTNEEPSNKVNIDVAFEMGVLINEDKVKEMWTDEMFEFYQGKVIENGQNGNMINKGIILEGTMNNEVGCDGSAHAAFMTQNNISSPVDATMACNLGNDDADEIKIFINENRLNMCAVVETRLKNKMVNKACENVFGLWNWVSNVIDCNKGYRLYVGWDNNAIDANLIASYDQVQKMKDPKNGIMKKLDRIMGNNEFLDQFGSCYATFLPYITSEHSPSLLTIPDVAVKRKKSFREVVLDEEKVLKQKTKVEWLKEGDHNSAYFYNLLKGRLNRSIIISIRDDLGRIYQDEEVAGQSRDCLTMIREVFDDKIRVPLHDIDDNKASGPKGFTSKFFKASRETIRKDFCLAMKEIFSSGKMLGELNATLISLIPKYDLILFCHGDLISASVMRRALDEFCLVSGLRPNMAKSTVFLGNVNDIIKHDIKTVIPFN